MKVLCQEPDGAVEREIKPLSRDPKIIDEVEKRMREVPNFLGETALWEIVFTDDSALFVVDDVGLLAVVNIHQGAFGDAHITFWDKVLDGREGLCLDVADFVMEVAQLKLLLTYIPQDRKRLIRFAYKVGFLPVERKEGVLVMALLKERNHGS